MRFTRSSKRITIALCVMLIAASVFSFAFILENADHDCIGEGCYTCVQIENAAKVLNQLGAVFAAVTYLFIAALISIAVFAPLSSRFNKISPVLLKVKLNN